MMMAPVSTTVIPDDGESTEVIIGSGLSECRIKNPMVRGRDRAERRYRLRTGRFGLQRKALRYVRDGSHYKISARRRLGEGKADFYWKLRPVLAPPNQAQSMSHRSRARQGNLRRVCDIPCAASRAAISRRAALQVHRSNSQTILRFRGWLRRSARGDARLRGFQSRP